MSFHRSPSRHRECLAYVTAAQGTPADQTDWQFQITPYVWGAGIGGRLVPFTGITEIQFEESFSEVLEDLDAAEFLAASARRGLLVFAGDLTFSKVSKNGVVGGGVPARARLQTASLTLLAGYSVVQTPDTTVDLMAGFRAWDVKASVQVPAAAIAESPAKQFVDPLLAVRGTFQIAPRWSTTVYADIGGFGVGSEDT
jgi:hypothetical protein